MSDCTNIYDLCVVQGCDKDYTMAFTTTGTTPYNLTDCTVKFVLTDSKEKLDTENLMPNATITYTDRVNGKATVSLSNTDTDLPLGTYYYRVKLINSASRIAAGAGILLTTNTSVVGLFQLDSGGHMVFRNRLNSGKHLYFDANSDVIFRTNSSSSVTTMTIKTSGNVGIGVASPNANAILDIASTTKAFMPPRMTTTQRDAIASPTAGMVIYNSTTNVLNFHNGTAWGAV